MSKRKKWRCFFCDEVFCDEKSAANHFGEATSCGSDLPACIDPLRYDEKARMTALREAQAFAVKCMREGQEAEDRADMLEAEHSEFFHYFGEDCTSMWLAGDRYKNALFELKTLREQFPESPRSGEAK